MGAAAADDNDPLAEPPAPLRQTSPDTLEIREGGGCMALFGLPFFLAGVFMALTATQLIPASGTPGQKSTHIALGLGSLLFLGVGGAFVFGRRWLTLDTRRKSLIRRFGLLIPIYSEERHLSEFAAVVIAYDPGDSDSPVRYPIRLRSATGKDFVITKPEQFSAAWKQAQYLSHFLRLPLADTITDHESVMSPERAGEALRERLASDDIHLHRALHRAERPARMRCEVYESAGSARIVIPGRKSLLAGIFVSSIAAALFLVAIPLLLRVFSQHGSPAGVRLFFVLVIVLIFGIPSIIGSVNLIVGSSRNRITLKASPEGLVIERQTTWSTRTTVISAADILDLDDSTSQGTFESAKREAPVATPLGPRAEKILGALTRYVPNRGIVVKSRQELATFGEGLPAEELHYLTFVLRKALAGR